MRGGERDADTVDRSGKREARVFIGLFVIAVLSALLAVAHAIGGAVAVDTTTAYLLALAATCLVLPWLKSIKFGDAEVVLGDLQALKGTVEGVHADLREVQHLDSRASVGILPASGAADTGSAGPRSARTMAPEALGLAARGTAPATIALEPDMPRLPEHLRVYDPRAMDPDWSADPNKGRFGGVPAANGRRLQATIRPAGSKASAACEVAITVLSEAKDRPLSGIVWVFLHPSFGEYARFPVPVREGVATAHIRAWGAFTVGVVADDGETCLELDLAEVKGGTPRFYEE